MAAAIASACRAGTTSTIDVLNKCIEAGKKAGVDAPAPAEKIKTNYIRA